jgi:hypothetical protein
MREIAVTGQGVGAAAAAVAHSRAMTNTAPSDNAPATIEFHGFARPIVVRIDAALMNELSILIAKWPWRRVTSARRWHVRVATTGSEYAVAERRRRVVMESLYPSAPQAMGAFTGALIAAALRQTRGTVSFHAGAASFSRGAVIVVGPSLAGKSSVALHMVANGGRLLGDDSVAVADGCALSFGLAPKLRLPLPADAGRLFNRFAGARIRRAQSGIAHLRLRCGEAAGFGQGAPLRGIVILRHVEKGAPSLLPADRSTAMRALVTHAFAPQLGAAALVARLAALANRVPAYTLEFSRSREAARVLRRFVEGG